MSGKTRILFAVLVVLGILVSGLLASGLPGAAAALAQSRTAAQAAQAPQAPGDGETPLPGWKMGDAPLVSPQEAAQILGAAGAQAAAATADSSTEITAEIQELARGLLGDPTLIYEYVRNHIEYAPYYGSLKGATVTLLERSGNDFDQASLMIALLRASGFSAQFVYGTMTIPNSGAADGYDLAHWLSVDPNPAVISAVLARGGIPAAVGSSTTTLDRVWVKATLDGADYLFDPAFKPYDEIAGLDLAAAMGYDQAELLAAAGGTVGTDYVQNLDAAGLQAQLAEYAGNLAAELAADHPNAAVAEVIGGRTIAPEALAAYPTALRFPSTTLITWTDIPDAYGHKVRVSYGEIDHTFSMPEIAGKRLAIDYATGAATAAAVATLTKTGPSPDGRAPASPQSGTWDFGTVDATSYTQGMMRLENGSTSWEVHVFLAANPSGAFSLVSGGGTHSLAPYEQLDIVVRFSGQGVPGTKTAELHIEWWYGGSRYYEDITVLTGVEIGDAQLWLDDVMVAEGAAGDFMTVEVDHPYAADGGTYGDDSSSYTLRAGYDYAIISDLGASRSGLVLQKRQRMLDAYRAAGLADDSRQVLGESLNIAGQTWMQQTDLSRDLLAELWDMIPLAHHRFGVMGQETGYYMDQKMQFGSFSSRHGDAAIEKAFFRAASHLASALEHGVLEQMQPGVPAVSTIRLLHIANDDGDKIFEANAANYATIEPQLYNYSASAKASFQARVNAGATLILPANGALTLGDWQGLGYIDYISTSTQIGMAMMIGGGYAGGAGVYPGLLDPSMMAWDYWPELWYEAWLVNPTSSEPVDLATGAYLLDNVDLAVGADDPLGLHLNRSYNSDSHNVPSLLGHGWSLNYDSSISLHSDAAAGFGLRQAVDATPLIVASVAIIDLMGDAPDTKDWVTSALTAQWAMEKLTNNAASVSFNSKVLTYIKLADGSYNPPPGVTTQLSQVGGLYRLQERFGTQIDFDADNRISALRDADGNTLSFSYSAGQLQTAQDAFGRTLTFSYTGDLLTSIADSTGRTVSYSYDANENLTGYTDPEGHTWAYGYDADHRVISVADPLGTTTAANTYDSLGRVKTQLAPRVDADGVPYTAAYTFYFSGFRNVEEDPAGNRTIYTYDAAGRASGVEDALGNRRTWTYDGQNHVVQATDARGNATTHQYDGAHNLVRTTDALGQATTFAYDAQHHLTSVTDPLGHATAYAYDAEHHVTAVTDGRGQATVMTYHPNGQLATVTDAEANGASYAYDSYGNPLTVTRTDGGTVTTTYNTRGDLLAVLDANGRQTSYQYDLRRLRTAETDARGYTSSYGYNAAGLLVSITDRRGHVTTKTYTPTRKEWTTTTADGAVRENVYDARDNLVAVVDPLLHTTSYAYDAANRLAVTTDALGNSTTNSYDENGNLLTVTDALGHVTTREYDALNRLVKTTDPLGATTATEYDAAGRIRAITDGLAARTEYQYDEAGRRTSVLHPGGDVESFEYDDLGNLTAFVNGLGERTTYAYDGMSRLTSVTNAEGYAQAYTYDPGGNKLTRVDAQGRTTHYQYDPANNLQTITYPDSSTASFQYDANGNLVQMTDAAGVTVYSYDDVDRLISVTDHNGHAVAYAYDLAGNRTRVTYPGSLAVTYGYDATGRAASVTDWAGRMTSYTLDEAGRLTGISYPNGVTAAYSLDAAGRSTGFTYGLGGTAFVERSIGRNALGYKTGETILAGLQPQPTAAAGQTLTYDAADRLTRIAEPAAQTDYAHDNDGNLTGNSLGLAAVYDFDNRLRQIQAPGDALHQYTYDGLGERTRRTVNGVTSHQVLDRGAALHNVLLETDAEGTPQRYFVWGPYGLISQVEADGAIHYAHGDELGSTVALTDAAGSVTDEFAYLPYGELAGRTGSTSTPYLYIGGSGVYHEFGALYQMKARYYDAFLKRFIAADPIGLRGGANLYAYANGNPLAFVDRFGLCAESLWSQIGSYLQQSANQLIFGNYSEDVTWLGTAAQVLTGIFDLDLPGDIRDITYDLTNWEWSWGHAGQTAIDLVGLIPVIGALKYTDEAAILLKNTDEAGSLLKGAGDVSVYRAFDDAGNVNYVGITNDLERRAGEHLASKGITIEPIPGLSGLSRSDARAVEQVLIETYGLGKNGGTLLNKINSIAATNPSYAQQLQRGAELLKAAGYPGY